MDDTSKTDEKKMKRKVDFSALYKKEDSWACWIGFIVVALSAAGVIGVTYKLPKLATWNVNPFPSISGEALLSYLVMFAGLTILYIIALKIMGHRVKTYVGAFRYSFWRLKNKVFSRYISHL